ncbi:MAG: phosphoribosylformylglycinamidine cyclo-ligase [Chloroflexota bacterium]
MNKQSAYAKAGVDLEAGNRATDLIKTAVQSTYTPQVLSEVGNFGGLFEITNLVGLEQPVLVASTDGVGTKTMVAAAMGRWDTIGKDIVNHCLNDILVQGAKPLFFLDYVASSKLDPAQIAAVVAGIAEACKSVGCALLGGETAEMPGVYQAGELDLVGTVVGIVERDKVIDGRSIQAGDIILGLPSTGLHTNGYTLARNALADLDWQTHNDTLGSSIGEALLTPHRAYLNEITQLLEAGTEIRGLAHITGGGLIDNPPRIFPNNLGAILDAKAWEVPPIFNMIQEYGRVAPEEMRHVFNMGLGMLVILSPDNAAKAKALLPELMTVGQMVEGPSTVTMNP